MPDESDNEPLPDGSDNEPLLPDIPEQPAPELPQIIDEEANPPNLGLPLSDYRSAYTDLQTRLR